MACLRLQKSARQLPHLVARRSTFLVAINYQPSTTIDHHKHSFFGAFLVLEAFDGMDAIKDLFVMIIVNPFL